MDNLQSNNADIIRALEEEARSRSRLLGLPHLAAHVKVRWNARLRTTAGRAHFGEFFILLNPRLLAHPEELHRTLLHELAHLVTQARYPQRRRLPPHGAEWAAACADLGIPGENRCHSIPLAPPRHITRRHLYHCPACLRTVRRVRPFRRAEACLTCCRTRAGGRYDTRFRFIAGPPPLNGNNFHQPELFQL